MNERRTNIEIIAPTIEEAVEKGLEDLGLSRDEVEIEILDEGSRGLFGLGSRQARVRLSTKSGAERSAGAAVFPESGPEPVKEPASLENEVEEEAGTVPAGVSTPELVETEEVKRELSPEEDFILTVAQDTVSELLEKMRVRAEVTAAYGEAEDARSRVPVYVNIHGNDLSILIGRRAETLNSLQYIASLIINKEIGRSIPLVVDVEGYRVRREGQLRQLAHRMADQAIKTGRRQVLEPMPANERRIIHVELRNQPEVRTESIGEEPRRKVTIIPNP
jgi:spoIIIJ-associated protein